MRKTFTLFLAVCLTLLIAGCSVVEAAYESTAKKQDYIVIFCPDGTTIEGLGGLYEYGNSYAWVGIDGIRYFTGIENVLVIRDR